MLTFKGKIKVKKSVKDEKSKFLDKKSSLTLKVKILIFQGVSFFFVVEELTTS